MLGKFTPSSPRLERRTECALGMSRSVQAATLAPEPSQALDSAHMTTATLITKLADLHQAPGKRKTALLLMGGGARTAYQAGVLRGIAKILELQHALPSVNPFQVVVGTSAGSINAAYFACRALRWRAALDEMAAMWQQLHVGDVYEIDLPKSAASARRWLSLVGLGMHVRNRSRSGLQAMLDGTPLTATLSRQMDFPGLDKAISAGVMHALGVTTSSYSSGEHITFVQGHHSVKPWLRPGRRAVMQGISTDHLLASSAIPFIFAPVPLYLDNRVEHFGDGSMRQLSPLSPTIHLGASRILAIGVGRAADSAAPAKSANPMNKPSLAQVAGHSMATVFLDTLRSDVEQTQRLNDALRQLPAEVADRLSFKPIDILMFLPSQPLEHMASSYIAKAPKAVRGLMRALGANESAGAGLASYLLFEPDFANALIELGEADAFARKAEVVEFFTNFS
jgi:NTE family protein